MNGATAPSGGWLCFAVPHTGAAAPDRRACRKRGGEREGRRSRGARTLSIYSRKRPQSLWAHIRPLSTVGTAKGAVGAARNSDNPFFSG